MNRAIIFAHYDIDGIIDPYVVEAINVYRRHADILLLVSASATSLPQELRETVDHFIPRSNVGYDFGSWKAGWLALKQRDSFDEIVFANDSVYGPLVDLPPALNAKKCVGADFWGMVLSEARETHVQSWFAGARQPVIRSGIFNSFWQAAGSDMRDKDELILRLEIGLSRLLVNSGFSLAGIYDGRERPFVTHAERLSHLSISRPFRSIKFIKKTLPWRMRGHRSSSDACLTSTHTRSISGMLSLISSNSRRIGKHSLRGTKTDLGEALTNHSHTDKPHNPWGG
jgi:lipopolysaccharide biosynthesis protein